MKVILCVENSKLSIKEDIEINLGQSITFGRSSGCNKAIDDNKMSGNHCRIQLKDDRLEIFDLNSKNGTYLNGIKIEQSEIFIGDQIKIGDSVISIQTSKLTQNALDLLTFPGPFKERMQYELKADFTGARESNQQHAKNHGEKSKVYSNKEIELRKKARTRIRLTKDEIRSKSPMLASFAFIIDLIILLGMIVVPIFMVNSMSRNGFLGISYEHFLSMKVTYIAILEITLISLYLFSQKYMKYSIGEKIAGIEDLHLKQ